MERIQEVINQQLTTDGQISSSVAEFTCKECGRLVKPVVIHACGQIKTFPGKCTCQIEKSEQATLDRERKQRQQHMQKLFSSSDLGPRFKDCTFDNFRHRSGTEIAFKAASDFIKKWPEQMNTGEGLLLCGVQGNGKSHLAAACVRTLVEQGYVAVFQPVTRLMYRLNNTYSGDSGESEYRIINALIDADLLVLDDIGSNKWTEKVEERLFTIIDGRYWAKRPMIITTNMIDARLMEQHLGKRSFDRLLEMCVMIENSASSYRVEIARSRLQQNKGA